MHNQSTTPTISVIVPVYNAEKYLRRCIDSVLAQTYTDFELLLIDDGSKDKSGEICDEYAIKDNRIRVVHKDNTGVSDTRNRGMDMAQGDYLMFLDADDFWVQSSFISLFIGKAREFDLDIVRGEYSAMNEDGTFAWSREIPEKRGEYAGKVLKSVDFLEYGICSEYFLWLSMFKRSSIGNIRFEVGRIFLEDMLFYSTFLLQDLKCMYVPDIRFYAYRKNKDSASNSVNVKKLADSFSMCYYFHELSYQTPVPVLREKYVYNSIMMYYWTLETMAMKAYYSQRKMLITELKLNDLLCDIKNWIKDSSRTDFSSIFYLSPAVGVNVFFLKRQWHAAKHSLKMFLLPQSNL